jgi:hypothetical protein
MAFAFTATLVYELHPQTEPDAARLLRAELVGRRWQDRYEGQRMPATALWIRRTPEPNQTTDDIHALCAADVHKAVAAVAAMGKRIALVRAFIQVTGTGTFGLVPLVEGGEPPRG